MGGQACVLYGAAEFSRDLDLALLPDPANLDRLQEALAELDAEVIAVPPFSLKLYYSSHQPRMMAISTLGIGSVKLS